MEGSEVTQAEVTDGALAAGTHSLIMSEGRTSRSCRGERTQKCFSGGHIPFTWLGMTVLMDKCYSPLCSSGNVGISQTEVLGNESRL